MSLVALRHRLDFDDLEVPRTMPEYGNALIFCLYSIFRPAIYSICVI
jgi:hypothetical protein